MDISGFVLATTNPARDPAQFNDLIVEAFVFDGNLERLSQKLWSNYFKDWIQVDPVIRTSFFKEVILSDKEKHSVERSQSYQTCSR